MDLVHLHLLLNHVPVIGTVLTALLLAWALLRRSSELGRVSLGLLGLLAVVAIVVYLTGEPADVRHAVDVARPAPLCHDGTGGGLRVEPADPGSPARIASASDPWGMSCTSIDFDWAAATASGLLVKNEPMAFAICPFRSSRPPPSPGSPTLLPMYVSPRVPVSASAWRR